MYLFVFNDYLVVFHLQVLRALFFDVVKLNFVFLIFACKLTVSKNLFQILNDLFFTREN